ncbi:MAG TPA: hypothetical protein VLS89_15420, partial [Candidatus Nanopelagicales bacterium]|nr:hypothetical protein [Candidatus Nanopelagicales bacterium]
MKPLAGEGLCVACHRAFLGEPTGNPHFLIGQDDITPWQRSAYAGSLTHLLDDPVPEQGCRGCHMPDEPIEQNEVA